MFRTNNCSSSGDLYKKLTVFFHASFEESSGWQDTINTDFIFQPRDSVESFFSKTSYYKSGQNATCRAKNRHRKWFHIKRTSLFFLWRCDPTRLMSSSFLMFLDHTQRHTTVGRTPLDEWAAPRTDLYVTKHSTHSIPSVGFEPTASGRRPTLRRRGHRDRLVYLSTGPKDAE